MEEFKMTASFLIGGVAVILTFIWVILFFVFWAVTIHKLKKNPATRDYLGSDWWPGKVPFNVAIALSEPRRLNRKARGGALGGLFADADLLKMHTSRFDRVLARTFFWTLFMSVFLLFFSAFLEKVT